MDLSSLDVENDTLVNAQDQLGRVITARVVDKSATYKVLQSDINDMPLLKTEWVRALPR